MAIALIHTDQPLGSPTHQKQNRGWVVDFRSDRAQRPDPLTGWAGGSETQAQVSINFSSRDAAVQYCQKQGLKFSIQEEPPRKKILLQSYSDNFR